VRASAARVLLPALGVLALVAVVAIAATGNTPSGSGGGRAPSESLLDTMLTLFVLALIPAAALLVYGLMQRKDIAREIEMAKRFRRLSFIAFALFCGLLMLAYSRLEPQRFGREDEIGEPAFPRGVPSPEGPAAPTDPTPYRAEWAWAPVIVVVALALVAGIALLVMWRRQKAVEHSPEARVAKELAAALDESLDDLRAEKDPRRAVIAAYARLERVLAAHRLPRRPSETPNELLARLLPDLGVESGSIRRLIDLYTWAKFSHHDVHADMKNEAIAALEQARDELRARSEREEELHAAFARVGSSPDGRTA
jgi:membrane protease YdiL (CAAX protease family)